MRRILISSLSVFALSVSGCASNYAGEGAVAGGVAGAVVAADDGDIGDGALIGAAIGAVAGTLLKKRRGRDCFEVDSEGRRFRPRGC